MTRHGFHHEGRTYFPDGAAPLAESPAECDARNRKQAAQEVEAFRVRTADRVFAYWRDARPDDPRSRAEITTWNGAHLARVVWQGRPYHCPAFGRQSTRINFTAQGIDGRTWYGTYYQSSGDYVRMRAARDAR
jgi:hypothetical protein